MNIVLAGAALAGTAALAHGTFHRNSWVLGSSMGALPTRDRALALTFDDGFTNFASVAWPLLREHGLPATLFVPTQHVGKSNRWATTPGGRMPDLPLLDWDDLARLAGEGVTLGAHTRSHADLRTLDSAALHDEIAGSFDDLERNTGTRPVAFAYPYGSFNDRAVAVARRTFAWACTTELRALATANDPHLLPRLDAYFLNGPGRLDAYGSARFRLWMSARAAVRRVRRR